MKKLIWCIGPEGMGHHMSQSIFEDVWKGKGKFDSLFPEIIMYWNNTITDNIDIYLNDLIVKINNSPYDTFIFTPSSPYDNPRDSIRRPDILQFYNTFKKILDIRILHLYRDPIEATYSLFRRGWCETKDPRIRNKILYQAKITEDNLLYNKAHLEYLGPNKWKTLYYKEVVEHPSLFETSLSNFTGIDLNAIKKGLGRITIPLNKNDIPKKELTILERFFSTPRISMWEDFYLSNKL